MTDRITLTRWDGGGHPSFDGVPPLMWTRDHNGEILITCANGHLAGINHDIDDQGNVNPSLLCRTPHGEGDGECGWHVFARLDQYAKDQT